MMNKPVFEFYNETTQKWYKIYQDGRLETTDKIGMIINRIPNLVMELEQSYVKLSQNPQSSTL